MPSRGRLRAGAVACLAATSMLGGSAHAAGEVGDQPTLEFKRCDGFLRPCTTARILAEGEHHVGRVEVVGFGSRRGLCLGADTFMRNGTSGFFGCGGAGPPSDGQALSLGSIGGTETRNSSSTQILGTVRSDVAGVRIRYRRGGAAKVAIPIFSQVDETLARRIGEPDPFGVVETTVRGCIEPRRFRVVAFSDDGDVLGRDRLPRFGRFCDQTLPPPAPGRRWARPSRLR